MVRVGEMKRLLNLPVIVKNCALGAHEGQIKTNLLFIHIIITNKAMMIMISRSPQETV